MLAFHELKVDKNFGQVLAICQQTKNLATFFNSNWIILHPGREHTLESYAKVQQQMDDPRLLIENMPRHDIYGRMMFDQKLMDLQKIKEKNGICFDIEKAIKAASFQQLDYKEYITKVLEALKPFYFHISGGDPAHPRDEHTNLWSGSIDWEWIKECLFALAKETEIWLVFETPKDKDGLSNDIKNRNYFSCLY